MGITQEQWKKVFLSDGFSIRCDETPDTCSAAAVYVLSDGVEIVPANAKKIPHDWDKKLLATISFMISCGGVGKYLQFGKDVIGAGSIERYDTNYGKTFPKASVSHTVLTSTEIKPSSETMLAEWVLKQIDTYVSDTD